MLYETTGPSNNPVVYRPPWIGELREALKTRALEAEPPPEPIAWPSLGLEDVENEKERDSLRAYALRFLENAGKEGARYFASELANAAAGYSCRVELVNTIERPALTVRVVRHLLHVGQGIEVLNYSLTPISTRHGCWPRVSVSVRSGRPQDGDFPRPNEGVDAIHLIGAHAVAADLVRHLLR